MRILLILLAFTSQLSAQSAFRVDRSNMCNFDGTKVDNQTIYAFGSSSEAEDAIKQILNLFGISPGTFIIKAASVDNASAVIKDGKRYILYSQSYMTGLDGRNRTKSYWIKMGILAHEIGHHLQAHTLGVSGSRPELELSADDWAGFALYKLGATLQEAQFAVQELAAEFETPTHPPKRARMEAIAVGFNRAKEQNAGRTSTQRDISNPPPTGGSKRSDITQPKSTTVRDTDGNTYSAAKMKDGRTWLTQNLNVRVNDSSCYDDKPSNCTKYGRLYNWEAAKTACTKLGSGWRLPTFKEWNQLEEAYGGYSTSYRALIKGGNSGFNALLGGQRDYLADKFSSTENEGYYWTDSEKGTVTAYYFYFNRIKEMMGDFVKSKKYMISCRCILDESR